MYIDPGQVELPPASLPEWMEGERGAQRLLLLVIGIGLGVLLLGELLGGKRRR